MSWSSCYTSTKQGGLSIKNLFLLNHALLLKKCREVASKASVSATFLLDWFLTHGLKSYTCYKKSSVSLGLKKLWLLLLKNIQRLVGNGKRIFFGRIIG